MRKVVTGMGFWIRLGVVSVFVAGSALAGAAAFAQGAADASTLKGDAVHGKAISYTCLGCHGVAGYRNAYPNYEVPKLEGQHPEYIVAALKEYKSGDRSHFTMHSQASELSDQDMADIAAYFAGTPLTPTGRPPTGVPDAANVCVYCHGTDGVSSMTIYPSLAGQHADYIVRALDEYRKGGRKNPIMATFAGQLTPAQIDTVAAYYSQMRPSLRTLARPSTRFTAQR